jgi:hypothetical protein
MLQHVLFHTGICLAKSARCGATSISIDCTILYIEALRLRCTQSFAHSARSQRNGTSARCSARNGTSLPGQRTRMCGQVRKLHAASSTGVETRSCAQLPAAWSPGNEMPSAVSLARRDGTRSTHLAQILDSSPGTVQLASICCLQCMLRVHPTAPPAVLSRGSFQRFQIAVASCIAGACMQRSPASCCLRAAQALGSWVPGS